MKKTLALLMALAMIFALTAVSASADDAIVLSGFYSMDTKLADRFNSGGHLFYVRLLFFGIRMHTDSVLE